MLRRNSVVIDPNKSAEFLQFLKTCGKSKEFWEENNKKASVSVDKAELDRLFEEDSGI